MYFSNRTKALFAAAIIATLLVLSGCAAEQNFTTVDATDDAAFNTMKEVDSWGDESDFFRITRLSDETTLDGLSHTAEFEGTIFTLARRQSAYALVNLVHNTSDRPHAVTLTLSFPTKIAPPGIGADAILAWDGGGVRDTLLLETDVTQEIGLLQSERGDLAIMFDGTGAASSLRPEISAEDGTVSYLMQLGEIDPDEVCYVFVPVGTCLSAE